MLLIIISDNKLKQHGKEKKIRSGNKDNCFQRENVKYFET